MLNVAAIVVDVLLSYDLKRISSYKILSSSNWINFGLFLIFIDWSKITFDFIFCGKFY